MSAKHTNTAQLYQLYGSALKFSSVKGHRKNCKHKNALALVFNRPVAENPRESAAIGGAGSSAATIYRIAVTFLASGAFVGYVPVVPGSIGSLVGLFVARSTVSSWQYSPAIFLTTFALVFVGACKIADCAGKILGHPDSPAIVIDEILGMIATMLGNPVSWPWLMAGFGLFRLFDILKPWPASWFDRMHGGAGVMLDDLAAAFYANVALRVLRILV
jgi:phosphatidylglycerophosphatase A